MNIEFGIVGLPQSGRTTVFRALTGDEGGGQGRDGARPGAHLGVAHVSDPRLGALTGMLRPGKTVQVSVSYVDVGASVRALAESKGIGGQLLSQLSTADALINVVRDFGSDTVPHPAGSLDVERDITAMNLEIAFSDLAIIDRRLERIGDSLKGARPAERVSLQREQDRMGRIRASLEGEVPIREQPLSEEDRRALGNFQFLTAKPMLILVNVGEERLEEVAKLEASLGEAYARTGCRVIALCAKLEAELSRLDGETAATWRAEFGLEESGLDRVIRESYKLLDLVTFFSTASSEVRAWPVPAGTLAPAAAGKIHSDMERGFIRAEVVGFDDLMACGGFGEARRRGLLRHEGKTYRVQDGDVITFLFNV